MPYSTALKPAVSTTKLYSTALIEVASRTMYSSPDTSHRHTGSTHVDDSHRNTRNSHIRHVPTTLVLMHCKDASKIQSTTPASVSIHKTRRRPVIYRKNGPRQLIRPAHPYNNNLQVHIRAPTEQANQYIHTEHQIESEDVAQFWLAPQKLINGVQA